MTDQPKRFDLGPPKQATPKPPKKPKGREASPDQEVSPPLAPLPPPAKPAPDPPRGLVCAVCGCQDFWVVYTRAWNKGRIMRRRECRHCQTRKTTFESA